MALGWRRIAELFRRRALDRQSADELNHHVELLIEERRRAGLSDAEARRAVRLEHGAADTVRADLADARAGLGVVRVLRDIGQARRGLRRAPGIAALSVLTMAVGLSACTVIFALVVAVALRPLPYPDAAQLVRVIDTNTAAGIDRAGAASGNIDDWRRGATTFDGLAGYSATGRTLSADGVQAEVVISAQITRDFFDLLRVPPLLGRTFDADDFGRARFNNVAAPVGADPVVVLGHALWRTRFGSDAGVIGRTVTIERRPFRVIGVMPAGFSMPDDRVQIWLPWDVSGTHPRDQHYLGVVARLKPGVAITAAEADLNRVAADLSVAFPATNRGWRTRLVPLRDEIVGAMGATLWLLLGAVATMLIVVCANVALLALMRGAGRAREWHVRLALGATPAQLRRETFLETAAIVGLGGVVAIPPLSFALSLLPRSLSGVPRLAEVGWDPTVAAFLGIATVTSAIAASLPATWRATVDGGARADGVGSVRATAGRRMHRLRDAIAASQIALAVVLLAGAGVAARSVVRLAATDSGFDAAGVLVAPVFLDNEGYGSGDRVRSYYATLFDQVRAIPGVIGVGGATIVPTAPLGPDFERPVWPDGSVDTAARRPASVRIITPDYFDVIKQRVADGRRFDARDGPDAPRVAMVTETLAARLWPGERAIGRRVVVDYSTTGTYPYEVVGVVGDVRFRGPRSLPQPELYFPHAQRPYLILNVVVRAAGDPRALVPAVRAALKAVDPQKPAQDLYTLDALVGATFARDRAVLIALAVFGAAAITLSMIGVFGVLAQRVRERAREIGIRIVIGADPVMLARWVARAGARMLVPGLAAGLLAALLASRAIGAVIVGAAAVDLVALSGAAALAAIAGAGAAVIPAWRAVRVDPVVVLRRDN